ncbi:hypothetical protein [Priestia endophytica]|uniref:DUF1129 family protein n=1 Tax=Priestia endophytica TaxID=135735 RepID=A0AAX1Q3Q6_9BACI|nr:hypothetical protein [Priestia endophytica]MCM3540336.1 hypothetical protein [Priestia endophytica]RAS73042.1 hypothetical protein A3864_21360 [Priestia endophytica]RAS87390.1 hypothetical protein A3863_16445 [Priestia endophytica]
MNMKDIIKRNRELQASLNTHNEKVYENMVVYIRLNSLSERATEETLLEILEHLVIGQQNGKMAEEIFGSDLKAYCDDVLVNLPKETKALQFMNILYFNTLIFMWMFIPKTIGEIIGLFYPAFSEDRISLLPFLISWPFTWIVIWAVLKAIKNSVYGSKGWIALGVSTFVIGTISYVLTDQIFKDIWTVPMNLLISISITCLLFTLQYAFKKYSTHLETKISYI